MIGIVRGVIWLGLWGGLVALVGSFAGALFPVGDSLAVFRVPIAMAVVVLAGILSLLGRRWAGLIFLSVAAAAVVPVAMMTLTPSTTPVGGVTLYQKNLFHRMSKPDLVTGDIRLVDPDVLTLEEVSRRSKTVLEDVKDRLPSQIQCISKRVGNVAIAARWPIVPGTAQCPDAPGLAVMQVEAPQGPLWIVALHLRWPYPDGQAAQLREVVPYLETLEGPIVLAGDFNMVPWSHALRQIAGATGSTRVGAAASTFPRFHPWVRLPIDHVFATGQGAIEVRPLLGSDHYGIVARITLDAD